MKVVRCLNRSWIRDSYHSLRTVYLGEWPDWGNESWNWWK